MDRDEPHLMPNEGTQTIQWTEWPTGALVAAGLFWPIIRARNWSGYHFIQ
jgi:hypothetical protein